MQKELQSRGIQTGIHYPIPVHLQTAHADLGHWRGTFPATEAAAASVLSLPMYPELPREACQEVAQHIMLALPQVVTV
jgi:dTDP-4-amino-4,6-dideoxygalactose transaminase